MSEVLFPSNVQRNEEMYMGLMKSLEQNQNSKGFLHLGFISTSFSCILTPLIC